MATLERISKQKIESARQLLLAEIYTEKADDRHVKRDAIKQLLGPLIAARESGLSFEEISKVFAKAGLALTPKTLERYYYSLKTEEDLAKEAKAHAEKVTKVRQAIEAKALRLHQEHGARVAYEFKEGEIAQPLLYNALQGAGPASPAQVAADAEKATSMTSAQKTRPASPAASKTAKRPADAVQPGARSPLANAPAPKQASGPGLASRDKQPEKTGSEGELGSVAAQATSDGLACTIDEIERASLATEERTAIAEDVEVRQERVYYVSGAPFAGTLTKKQIHLLRTVGRIIALTSGKSSKDFVSMPSKI